MPLPKLPAPYRHPTDAEYTAVRRQRIGGVDLQPGERLPVDSPVRSNPRRLETLCRQRFLSPVMAQVQRTPKPQETKPITPEVDGMDRSTLVATARRLGLPANGTSQALRDSIRAHLRG